MKVRAAVLESYSSKLSVENVELGEPRMGEVLVKMISASICHTDIGGIQGHYEMLKLPVILGHEGAGIVESVGAGVTKVKPGDHALISVVVHCNRCSNCYKGLFYGCERFDRIAFGGDLLDGSKRLSKDGREISHF